MATRPPDTIGADEWTVVRLSEVPYDLRIAVAHDLAKKWQLRGITYAVWMLRVQTVSHDVVIDVPLMKAELVRAGKRPTGTLEADLKICPSEFAR